MIKDDRKVVRNMCSRSSWEDEPGLVRFVLSVPGNDRRFIVHLSSLDVQAVVVVGHYDQEPLAPVRRYHFPSL